MSDTRTYSDYVCRSVNGSEKKRNCSRKDEVEGEGADQWTEVKHVLVDLSRAVEGTAVIVKFGLG